MVVGDQDQGGAVVAIESKQQINGRAQSQKAVQSVREMMDSQTTTGSGPMQQAAD